MENPVTRLIATYGAPSQDGFGSAVFSEPLRQQDIEQAALAKYRFFVGDELWERFGEEAWMGPWREVYARSAATPSADVVVELRAILDREVNMCMDMIMDVDSDGALAAVYNDTAMSEVRAYKLGDSAAMFGFLIAGHRAVTDEATFLVFLMD